MGLKYDVSDYKEYVTSGVLKNYHKLPENAKATLGVDDCVQEALLYLHRTLNRLDGRKAKFSHKKSSLKTWIYYTVESYFNHVIKAHYRNKRTAVLIPLDVLVRHPGEDEKSSAVVNKREVIDKILQMHLDASPELMDFLHDNVYAYCGRLRVARGASDFKLVLNPYTKTFRKMRCTNAEIFARRKEEFTALAKRHRVTFDDYKVALSAELR